MADNQIIVAKRNILYSILSEGHRVLKRFYQCSQHCHKALQVSRLLIKWMVSTNLMLNLELADLYTWDQSLIITMPVYTVRRRFNAIIFSKSSQKTSHNSLVRARCRVSFANTKFGPYSAVAVTLLYVISWYIASRYNGSRLYHKTWRG